MYRNLAVILSAVMSLLLVLMAYGVDLPSATPEAKMKSQDIAKNAVRSKHIKNGQVKSSDIRDGTVRGDLPDFLVQLL